MGQTESLSAFTDGSNFSASTTGLDGNQWHLVSVQGELLATQGTDGICELQRTGRVSPYQAGHIVSLTPCQGSGCISSGTLCSIRKNMEYDCFMI